MLHGATTPLMLSNLAAAWTFWIAYAIWSVPEFLGGFRQRSSVTGATARDRGSYFAVVGSMSATRLLDVDLARAGRACDDGGKGLI